MEPGRTDRIPVKTDEKRPRQRAAAFSVDGEMQYGLFICYIYIGRKKSNKAFFPDKKVV